MINPKKLLLLKALRQLDGSFKLKTLIWKKNKCNNGIKDNKAYNRLYPNFR